MGGNGPMSGSKGSALLLFAGGMNPRDYDADVWKIQ
jgi:hypothetical protein